MKILLATDGSDFAREAVNQCCEIISKPDETTVEIISVVDSKLIPVPAYPFDPPGEYVLGLEQTAKESASEAKQRIQERFKNAALKLETNAFFGSPKKAIVEEAEKWKADLVVVGSHGCGFWERIYPGSVSGAVARHAPCSVLVVRKKIETGKED